MGLVLTDDRHYKAIADTIRENAPIEQSMTPAEMADHIAAACEYQHDSGYGAGVEEGADLGFSEGYSTGHSEGYDEGHADGYGEGHGDASAECAEQHFVHNFVGDGSGSFSIEVPFEPDTVFIFSTDPTLMSVTGSLSQFFYDRRGFGQVGGYVFYGSGRPGVLNMALTTKTALDRYSQDEDGVVTVKNIGGSNTTITYANGFVYTFVAVKYAEQSDKERITEFVNRLTGSGSTTLNQAKVEAAFTDEEWTALINTKPDWRFTLF